MEDWQKIAVREVEEMFQLLHRGDFTVTDLCDRLRGLLEFLELDPTKEPFREDCD